MKRSEKVSKDNKVKSEEKSKIGKINRREDGKNLELFKWIIHGGAIVSRAGGFRHVVKCSSAKREIVGYEHS